MKFTKTEQLEEALFSYTDSPDSPEKAQLKKYLENLEFYINKENYPLVDKTLGQMIAYRQSMATNESLIESLSENAKELILDECGYNLQFGGSEDDLLEDILDILTYHKETFDKDEVISYMNKCLSGEIKKPQSAVTVTVDLDSKFSTHKLEDIDPKYCTTVGELVEYLDTQFDDDSLVIFTDYSNTSFTPVNGGAFRQVDNIYAKDFTESLILDESQEN